MGAMMGAGGWMILWIILGVAATLLAAAGAVWAARSLASRNDAAPQIPAGTSPAVDKAKDVLRLRYAQGEISREDYLQGKVELED
jgi:putative membrane protein